MTIPLGILAGSMSGSGTWTSPAITSRRYYGATYASGFTNKYFAISSTASYEYSPDGITFSTGTLPGAVGAISYTSSYIVGHSGGSAYYSSNGTTWTSVTIGTGWGTPRSMIYDGTRLLMPSSAKGAIGYSTTGSSWSSITRAVGNIICQGSTTYIITPADDGSSTTGSICTSNPTVVGNWSNLTFPAASTNWTSLVYGAGVWVLKGTPNSTTYYTSANDGSTWTSRTLPTNTSDSNSGTDNTYIKMGYARGYFYYYYNGNVYSSPDGVTWTATAMTDLLVTNPIFKASSWIYDGVKLFAFGMSQASPGPTAEYLLGAY